MPIYEYFCPQCQNKFEELRQFRQSDDGAICPKCDREVARVMSAPASYSCSLNWTQTDGEGFTSKYMRREEIAELDAECRER